MNKEDAKKLKKGDHVLTIGIDKVVECEIETVSEYGSVNIHTVDNREHYYRTPEEFFPLMDENISIDEMFYRQLCKQIADERDKYVEETDEYFKFLVEIRESNALQYKNIKKKAIKMIEDKIK